MTVGTKELKNRLSEYLRRVKEGDTIYVTDRGRIIAEIKPTPPSASTQAEALRRLAAEGTVTSASGRHEDFPPHPPLRKGKLASRMIVEDRG